MRSLGDLRDCAAFALPKASRRLAHLSLRRSDDVGRSCDDRVVDIIDTSDYDFLLPRRLRKAVAVGLLVGVAFVPPAQRWWIDQVNHHAEHVTREFVARFYPTGKTTDGPLLSQSR